MKLTEFDGCLIRRELRMILRLPGWVTNWEAAGIISLHRECCRPRRGAHEFALERKHLGEDVQTPARCMVCLDPELPCTTKPTDMAGEASWQEVSVVVEGMDLDELTQGAVKENEEKHMNGTVQETILPGVEIGATVENGEEPLTDKKQKSAKWGPRSWRKQSF